MCGPRGHRRRPAAARYARDCQGSASSARAHPLTHAIVTCPSSCAPPHSCSGAPFQCFGPCRSRRGGRHGGQGSAVQTSSLRGSRGTHGGGRRCADTLFRCTAQQAVRSEQARCHAPASFPPAHFLSDRRASNVVRLGGARWPTLPRPAPCPAEQKGYDSVDLALHASARRVRSSLPPSQADRFFSASPIWEPLRLERKIL